MTKAASGTATTIASPATEGTYKLFVLDAAGNISSASTASVIADRTAPTNPDTVLAATAYKNVSGAAVTIVSSGDATNDVWLAPSGTTTFTAGATMTKAASGTATTIASPATEGTYKLFVLDAAGNISSASTASVIADRTAPTATSVNSDVVGTYASGNVLTFTFDAAVNAITGYTISGDPAHVAGSQAPTITFTPGATTATLTLGDGETVALGDIITLTGVTDVAGNTAATLAFGALAAAAPG
jgi:hypothetical protein